MKKKAARKKSSTPELKDDERKWIPITQSANFESNGFCQEELTIRPTGSFDGTAEKYSAGFNYNNRICTLKSEPNPILEEPHSIKSFYSTEFGITTSHDYARVQAFKRLQKSTQESGSPTIIYYHGLESV